MTRNQLIEKVLARMDEMNTMSEGATIVDYQVEAELDNSAVELMTILPPYLCAPSTATPAVTAGEIACPTDFLRIAELKMSGWDRPVSSLIPINHQRVTYSLYDYYKPSAKYPSGVLKNTGSSSGAMFKIKVEPWKTGDTVATFIYVKRPANAEAIPDELADIFAWLCASRVYRVHGEHDMAKNCEEKLVSLVQTSVNM
jgi:hypothetical protein